VLPLPISPVFGTGDLVEVDTESVRAVARVRESSEAGRLHIAFEMGEYLPWVDANVQVRHFGNDVSHSCTARIIHAGSSTALLQIVDRVEAVPPSSAGAASGTSDEPRGSFDTIPSFEE
jgi:hypothetical protein